VTYSATKGNCTLLHTVDSRSHLHLTHKSTAVLSN